MLQSFPHCPPSTRKTALPKFSLRIAPGAISHAAQGKLGGERLERIKVDGRGLLRWLVLISNRLRSLMPESVNHTLLRLEEKGSLQKKGAGHRADQVRPQHTSRSQCQLNAAPPSACSPQPGIPGFRQASPSSPSPQRGRSARESRSRGRAL